MNRTQKWLGLAALALALLATTGCVDRAAQAQAAETEKLVSDPSIAVDTVRVAQRNLPLLLETTGSLVADAEVDISPKVPGRLVAVFVRDGDSVAAGQIIAQQETSEARARLSQALAGVSAARSQLQQAQQDASVGPARSAAAVRASEARVRQARTALQEAMNGARPQERRQSKANLDRAKSDLDTAQAAFDRSKRLYEEGAISKQDLELAENRLANAQAGYTAALEANNLVLDAVRPEQIEQLREGVRQAEQQLEIDRANQKLDPVLQQRVEAARANLLAAEETVSLARINLNDHTIRASVAGRVSGRPATVGTMGSPGLPIAKVIGAAGIYYEADVAETDVARVRAGMPVTVTIEALGGATMTGTIASINPKATGLGRLFTVRVLLTERLGDLKAGMFARGVARLGEEPGALVLPETAVIRDGETAFVFAVEGDKAKRRAVTLVRLQGGQAVITGLAPDTEVVAKGQDRLTDGATVRRGGIPGQPQNGGAESQSAEPKPAEPKPAEGTGQG